MKDQTFLHLALSVHSAALSLYPEDFQDSFREEMQVVFALTAKEASAEGLAALGGMFLREMRDLIWTAWEEKRRARRSDSDGGPQPAVAGPRFSRSEMLAALAVFLIPTGYVLISSAPGSAARELILRLTLVLGVMGAAAGLLRRFPRWSLAYLGLVFSAIVFSFLFQWKTERIATALASRYIVQSNNELGRLILVSFWQGVVWLSLFALIAVLILLLRQIPAFRPWVVRLRDDWTQLSYLLYGSSTLAVILTFDDYTIGTTPFTLAALLCMAAGAWSYLRSSHPNRGFRSLVVGATLAMWVAAAGVWLLAPRQDWAVWFSSYSPERERWFEALQALIGWGWMVMILALPALLRYLPRRRDPFLSG